MFNTSGQNSNPDKLWALLGTFYELLPEESRKSFETYFEGLSRMNYGLSYNLRQEDRLRYLNVSKGWYEILYQDFEFIVEDLRGEGRENVTPVYLPRPANVSVTGDAGTGHYAYRVTALNSAGETVASTEVTAISKSLPLQISWDAVSGAMSYRVYGRSIKDHRLIGSTSSTSFTDDGQAEPTIEPPKSSTALAGYEYSLTGFFKYLSIPKFTQNGSIILEEGDDYSIRQMRKIFFKPSALEGATDLSAGVRRVQAVAPSILAVSPVISEFYFKAFGVDPKAIFGDKVYRPFLDSYGEGSPLEDTLLFAEHLRYFTWAYSEALRRKPTISNLSHAYAIARGYPFAYERGSVTNVTDSSITIGDFTYDVGEGNEPRFSVGETVGQFDVLVEGVKVHDWYSNQELVELLADDVIEPRLAIVLEDDNDFTFDPKVVQAFKQTSIPAGLHVIEMGGEEWREQFAQQLLDEYTAIVEADGGQVMDPSKTLEIYKSLL